MHKNNFEILLIKISLIIVIIGIVIFSSLIKIQSSLLFGWLAGTFVSILNYFLSLNLINKFFKKKKNKIQGFWTGTLRFYLSLLLQVSFFIIVITINKYSNGYKLLDGPISLVYKPINIFTYISGISIFLIGIFITQMIIIWKGKDVTNN